MAKVASDATPGRVSISEATCQALTGDWTFGDRHLVTLKGVGEIATYVVAPG